MTKQVHSNSLADYLGQDEHENKDMPKSAVSAEVQDLISKIPNRTDVTVCERKLVLEKNVLEVQSA